MLFIKSSEISRCDTWPENKVFDECFQIRRLWGCLPGVACLYVGIHSCVCPHECAYDGVGQKQAFVHCWFCRVSYAWSFVYSLWCGWVHIGWTCSQGQPLGLRVCTGWKYFCGRHRWIKFREGGWNKHVYICVLFVDICELWKTRWKSTGGGKSRRKHCQSAARPWPQWFPDHRKQSLEIGEAWESR